MNPNSDNRDNRNNRDNPGFNHENSTNTRPLAIPKSAKTVQSSNLEVTSPISPTTEPVSPSFYFTPHSPTGQYTLSRSKSISSPTAQTAQQVLAATHHPMAYSTTRSFSEGSSSSPTSPITCPRHHHRRSSVAIKFKPTFCEDFQLREPQDIDSSGNSRSGSATASRSSSLNIKRPPTPIAERILKGDFSF